MATFYNFWQLYLKMYNISWHYRPKGDRVGDTLDIDVDPSVFTEKCVM